MTLSRVRRVRLRSYRSIESCDVELPMLSFLVGPNGSGKSNFLDALRFVSDALKTSLEQALRTRGGFGQVALRPHAPERIVRLELGLVFTEGSAEYAFEFTPRRRTGLAVEETCTVRTNGLVATHYFDVRHGNVTTSEAALPDPGPGRLYLANAASLPVFRPVYDLLSRMTCYDFNADAMKSLQVLDSGDELLGDGSNLASVFRRLKTEHRDLARLVVDYLGAVTPGVTDVDSQQMKDDACYVTLSFTQQGDAFRARSVSDGTLRALAVLTAAFHDAPALVGIEEPVSGVHPAAANVLREALVEASSHRQLVVASHSPELLDDPELPPESIVAMQASGGLTRLGPLDRAGRMALRERLYTAGELLRLDQLHPDPDLDGEVAW